MKELLDYIVRHTERGECQCGQCLDKGPDRDAPEHSVDVHFFWVSPQNAPSSEEFRNLIQRQYPSVDRLANGPSYIEIGAELGSQDLALRFIGLGGLLGLWSVITPKAFGFAGKVANELAGNGMVMCSGLREPATVGAK